MKIITCSLFSLLSIAPIVVLASNTSQLREVASHDRQVCNNRYYNNCLNVVCLTSNTLDCRDQCKKAAEQNCAALQN